MAMGGKMGEWKIFETRWGCHLDHARSFLLAVSTTAVDITPSFGWTVIC